MRHTIKPIVLTILFFCAASRAVSTNAFAATAQPTVSDSASKTVGLPPGQSVIEQNPSLKSFLFTEPKSDIYFGFGLTPVNVMKSRVGVSFSFFQLHYIRKRIDFEVFNASFGAAIARDSNANSSQFLFRTAPKFRIFPGFSIGPMLGMEFISFSSIQSRIVRDRFFSRYEPFSTRGFIVGIMASQLVPLGGNRFLRINESAYQQNYSVTKAGSGWDYEFENPSLQADAQRTLIKPGNVYSLEFSLLF